MKTRDEINAQRKAHYAANRDELAAQRRVRDRRYKAKRKAAAAREDDKREQAAWKEIGRTNRGLWELFEAIRLVARAWLWHKAPYVAKESPYRLHPPTLLVALMPPKERRPGPLTRALSTATL